ncbi:hypothetical protein M404DRAFT_1004295 [Pisolithus tinctorius Marx 270]|uniref:Uncharacterized protein n=1 Tax=Pisolithus tinctorius Marx 270 TaxID=870435 RepID=A0A0C3NXD5_PISTI|nr:hypothetical protein M404DRAFT_1004295 [Pisolithus tinctorius Marx 270]
MGGSTIDNDCGSKWAYQITLYYSSSILLLTGMCESATVMTRSKAKSIRQRDTERVLSVRCRP